jgi:hypothetical protein
LAGIRREPAIRACVISESGWQKKNSGARDDENYDVVFELGVNLSFHATILNQQTLRKREALKIFLHLRLRLRVRHSTNWR